MPWFIAVILVSYFTNRAGAFLLPIGSWWRYSVSIPLLILGISVLVLGLKACPLRIISGRHCSILITNGIYSYVRNPICLSCVLLAFSAGIWFGSMTGLAVALLSLLAAYLHALLWEERKLEKRFGGEYLEYKRKVGMFIPKPPFIWNKSGKG